MILDMDVGNSRVKWRLSENGSSTTKQGIAADLAALAENLRDVELQRIRAACVRRQQRSEEILGWGQQQFGLSVELARVIRHWGNLEIFYQEPERLGVDRWLAMLAATANTSSASVTVDCGTALTVDMVDAQGKHQGGYIVPGLRLSATALEEHTAIRLGLLPETADTAPGHSTDAAVFNGVLAMLLGLIERAMRQSNMNSATLFITGGDAPRFIPALHSTGFSPRHLEGMVLDGLALALP